MIEDWTPIVFHKYVVVKICTVLFIHGSKCPVRHTDVFPVDNLVITIRYTNRKCIETNIYQKADNKICYINEYVPKPILDYWNSYLNQCYHCKNCKKDELELLTVLNYNSINCKYGIEFFTKQYIDLIDWLKKKIKAKNFTEIPPSTQIEPELKFEGDWGHHHSHDPVLKKILNDIKDSNFINSIIPKGFVKKPKSNKLKMIDYNTIGLIIKTKDKGESFILNTTAENSTQNKYITERLKGSL